MATAAPNPRASLLSGLRTGGVRATSNPLGHAVPHTAAPGGSFNIPRFSSSNSLSHFPEEDEHDILPEMVPQTAFVNHAAMRHQAPMTAAVDGGNNRFIHQQQQSMPMNGGMQFNPAFGGMMNAQAQAQAAQAMQMQMMQMEIMRLQALQAQQMQAEMIAQAQRQQQQQQQQQNNRRMSFNPPATAGPMTTSFEPRLSLPDTTQNWRSGGAPATNGRVNDEQVPMTAAIGGRFGARAQLGRLSDDESDKVPPTPSRVISGGTALGNLAGGPVAPAPVSSKADGVSTWRRGGANNSVLSRTSSPSVKITPPPSERVSPPPAAAAATVKARPAALNFSVATSAPLPAVAIDGSEAGEADEEDAPSSSTSTSSGAPLTPPESAIGRPPLSPREEATKKLYEGLGIGRVKTPQIVVEQVAPVPAPPATATVARIVSQAVRMPRGPPSGADELGPKNFASRIRRKAIGGLGALMDARERREVEAF